MYIESLIIILGIIVIITIIITVFLFIFKGNILMFTDEQLDVLNKDDWEVTDNYGSVSPRVHDTGSEENKLG